jgi:uncharacterized protein YmfQ (DUF2313 family)
LIIPIYGEQVSNLQTPAANLDVSDVSEQRVVFDLFPLGEYFSRDAGWLPRAVRAIARFFSRLRRRREAFVRNIDPRQADELLDDWEQLYELEPEPGQTLADRQDAVLVKVRSLGGVNKAYYEGLAIDFGYLDAVVEDAADPFTTISLCDDFLQDGEWKLTFKLTATSQGAARDALLVELINSQLLAGWFALFEFT